MVLGTSCCNQLISNFKDTAASALRISAKFASDSAKAIKKSAPILLKISAKIASFVIGSGLFLGGIGLGFGIPIAGIGYTATLLSNSAIIGQAILNTIIFLASLTIFPTIGILTGMMPCIFGAALINSAINND